MTTDSAGELVPLAPIPTIALPPLVTLEEAKAWLRLEADDTEEDALIQTLIDAAIEAVIDRTNVATYQGSVPARIRLAILTHVAGAWSNREDGADLPASANRLLDPMRKLDI